MSLHVAVVTLDPKMRERAARAFDGAPDDWRITLEGSPPSDADIVIAGPDLTCRADLAYDGTTDLLGAVRSLTEDRSRRCLHIGGLRGSGRTSVALHVAAALTRSSSVCVIDRDPTRGMAHRLLIDDVPKYVEGSDVLLAAVPVRGGFRVLACADPDVDPVRAAAAHFDVCIVDGDPIGECDVVLLPPSIPNARRLREALPNECDPMIVTNRLGRGGAATRRDLERILLRRIALELPHAPTLRDAEDAGRLVPTWTRWWHGIARLAGSLGP